MQAIYTIACIGLLAFGCLCDIIILLQVIYNNYLEEKYICCLKTCYSVAFDQFHCQFIANNKLVLEYELNRKLFPSNLRSQDI